nr:reverse transcriptase domain-containing protein [Tanacetum cinerariifolium]
MEGRGENDVSHRRRILLLHKNSLRAKECWSHLSKVGGYHIRRNQKGYVDDMVIKSKTEQDLIQDVEKTLLTLKKVNMKLNPKKFSFRIEESKFLGYIVTYEGIRENPKITKAVMSMPSSSNLKQMQSLSGKLTALNKFLSKVVKRVIPCLDTLKKYTKKDFRWTEAIKEAFQAMKSGKEGKAATNSLHAVAGDDPTCEKDPSIDSTLVPKDMSESSKVKEEQTESDPSVDMDVWKLYIDGASNDHGYGA